MKFTDGYWQFRPNVTPHFPVHVHDVEVEPDALVVYGATKRLLHRGDTLNTGLLTVRFSAPMPNVIRVQLTHHKGGRTATPTFPLHFQPVPNLQIQNNDHFASLTSGNLTARVDKGPNWRVDYLDDGRFLTQSGWRGMGYIDTDNGRFIHEQLNLSVGECVYGLGESFTPFVKNGQVIDLFLTGETAEGGRWLRETYDFFSLPLWVRPNSIIPVGSNDGRPDYDFADGLTFHIFTIQPGATLSTTVPTLTGHPDLTLHVRSENDTLHIEAEGITKPWQVLLRGITAVSQIEGGTSSAGPQGILLIPAAVNGRLSVKL